MAELAIQLGIIRNEALGDSVENAIITAMRAVDLDKHGDMSGAVTSGEVWTLFNSLEDANEVAY